VGDNLAGVGLLVRGRHELFVSSLAALLESRGALVRVSPPDAHVPRRLPPRTRLVLLESPIPSELRRTVALGAPVIVLAERADPEDRLAAAQLGARELLAKNATLAELMVSIRRALEKRGDEPGILPPEARYELTPRQREVLGLIVEGLDNREIAARLGITERTARAHVSAVLERLGAANRTQAAVTAVQRGILGMLLLIVAVACLAVAADRASAAPDGAIPSLGRSIGGSSGIWAYDTTAGRLLASRRASSKRAPASVEKLLTSATALDRAGPESQFQTTAAVFGTVTDGVLDGDLYLQGHGDPSLDYAGLGRLATAVKRAGIRKITGHVYGDESYFDSRRGGPASGYTTSVWVGPLSALGLNGGLMRPFGRGFQSDPPSFAAGRMESKLKSIGVTVERQFGSGVTPVGAQVVATTWSQPLAALVRHMNTLSDNYYAEMLIKALGAGYGSGGTTERGAAVVQAFESERGISSRVVDGSGLSLGDAVSPRMIGRLLAQAPREPWFNAFYSSLPLAGVSGTLDNRMRGTAAAGRCRAKTGTLIGVSALAGYCRSRSGHRLVFAILMNRVSIWGARRTQDRIAATLAAYRG
jgi:D-alanyl-D-alanine carboxypeptidase/D-alanyl-D-alanine-endopeptidase (penicillin-binding protein 4)